MNLVLLIAGDGDDEHATRDKTTPSKKNTFWAMVNSVYLCTQSSTGACK